MRDNRTKRLIGSGGRALGLSMTITDPFVSEVVGAAGFDFVLIDTEHGPIAIDQLQSMLIALRGSVSTVLVRIGPGQECAGLEQHQQDPRDSKATCSRSATPA